MHCVIFGAGRFGRVVYESLCAEGHEVIGWLDDNQELHGKRHCGLSVLGGLDWLRTCGRKDMSAIAAIGYSALRVEVAARIERTGVPLINSIHPSAVVMPSVTLGRGNMICAGAVLQSNVRVGNNVIVNTASTIDHDSVLEDGVWIAPGVHTGGGIKVRRGAYVSIGAVLAAGVSVGEGAVVGAGAVITNHVPPRVLAVGAMPRFIPIEDTFDWERLISGVPSA